MKEARRYLLREQLGAEWKVQEQSWTCPCVCPSAGRAEALPDQCHQETNQRLLGQLATVIYPNPTF